MSSAIYPSLKGKRVVITGGGSGIGAGIVAGFARQGSEVIFLDVADEDSKHPLTDQAIVNILKESGVQIARRTVAKYRDQLGVLSARMRKRV